MSTLYLIDLESVETRYTCEWKRHLPKLLGDFVSSNMLDWHIKIIAGPTDIPDATTPGAFLNFGGTNIYKSSQLITIARMFCDGSVKAGDKFLYTDAWNPTILQVKYMSELLQIPIEIHALWHAGSYDPQDFLGRLIGDKPWVRHTEKALLNAIDYNWFATQFHINLFKQAFDVSDSKLCLTGWPMEYLQDTLTCTTGKKDIILFPHRIAPEKQVEIFKDLAKRLPEFEFIVCQESNLTKEQYHVLLMQSKIVFSANLQETLGISCYEGVLSGALPMVPDRLSYSEMYDDAFKYPSEWTSNWDNYMHYADQLTDTIRDWMHNYQNKLDELYALNHKLTNFFNSNKLLKSIFNV